MKIVEHHITPDGLLKLIVADYGDDIALGFDGFPWHTHPECLPSYSAANPQVVVKQFIEALISDKLVIGMRRINNRLVDAWVVEVPTPDKYKPAEEEIEYRYWSGRKFETSVA